MIKDSFKDIIDLLEPLFERALKEKKWFRSNYQGIYFSPKELRAELNKGKFVWGPVNWMLVDPPAFRDLEVERVEAFAYNEQLQRRINEGWK